MKIYDQRWAFQGAYGSINKFVSGDYEYYRGHYVSELGVCLIYSQYWKKDNEYTLSLDIYLNGVGYHRTINRRKEFTERSMAIFAGKFQREVYENLNSQGEQHST